MDFLDVMKSRRSVRKFTSKAVSDPDLQIVLEAARWAPSWANSQCWRFVVVREGRVKGALAGTLLAGNPAAQAVREAPVVIVVCAELGKSGFYKGQPATDKGDWFMFDVAQALQNLDLVAQSLGLGTVHVRLFDADRAGEIINAPDNITVVELMPVGYPESVSEMASRKEPAEVVFYENFETP